MDKLDFIKIKSFCSVKNNIKKKKVQSTYHRLGGECLQRTSLIKECHPKYAKKSYNSVMRKPNIGLENGSERYTDDKYMYEKMLHVICHQGNAS